MTEADVIQPSASIASPGLGIRYIGKDHCYAFSGTLARIETEQTALVFNSGSGYIVATLTMTGPMRMTKTGVGSGGIRGYQLDFNNQTVGLYKVDSINEDMPFTTEAQILIPPFTAVALTYIDDGTDGNYHGTANITGRVYGAT